MPSEFPPYFDEVSHCLQIVYGCDKFYDSAFD